MFLGYATTPKCQVSFLRKNCTVGHGEKRRFPHVFRGGFGKSAVLVWCFCGEFVVDCVVKLVKFTVFAQSLKTGQFSNKYFHRILSDRGHVRATITAH